MKTQNPIPQLLVVLALMGCGDPWNSAGEAGTRRDVALRTTQSGEVAAPSGVLVEPARHGEGFWSPGLPSWLSETHRQHYYVTDFSDVEVVDEILDDQTGEWRRAVYADSAAFSVLRVGSATKGVFCLAGIAADGDFVLSRWTLRPAPVHRVGGGGGVGGTATGEPGPLGPQAFEKVVIHRGPLASGVIAVNFDPEQRFLLALLQQDDERTLYRFANEPSTIPLALLDSTELPELAQVWNLQRMQHDLMGRVWMMDDHPVYDLRIAFVDAENDGAFDGPPLVADRAWWEASGMDDYELWDSLLGP